MDALWEKHPRRLSEAGLRRSSGEFDHQNNIVGSLLVGYKELLNIYKYSCSQIL